MSKNIKVGNLIAGGYNGKARIGRVISMKVVKNRPLLNIQLSDNKYRSMYLDKITNLVVTD